MELLKLPSAEETEKAGGWDSLLARSWLAFENPESPAPVTQFLALPDGNDRTPPDTHGAVSPDRVMTVLNTSIRVQTRSGALIKTTALSAFWAGVGPVDPFDPRCVYDPYARRWIVSAGGNLRTPNSVLLLGVSETASPEGAWHLYRLPANSTTTWIDYPAVGFNEKWVVVQMLMKTLDTREFHESRIYAFDKVRLYAGGPAEYTLFRGASIDEVQAPAVTVSRVEPDLYLLTSPVRAEAATELVLHKVTGSVGAEELVEVNRFPMTRTWAARPPGTGNFAPQKGADTGLHMQPAWMHNVVHIDGRIWATHHAFFPVENPTRTGVHWVELTPDRIVQEGWIEDPDGRRSYGYPSIGVNRRSDVLLGFSRFAPDEYASAAYALRLGTDPPGTLRPDHVFKAGEGPYLKTRQTGENRWGDYSSTVVDPADGFSFWTIQTYASTPDGDPDIDGSGRWGTWWAKVRPDDNAYFAEIRLDGADVVLQVSAPPGIRYRVERTSELSASWMEAGQVEGQPEIVTFREARQEAMQFYRLVAE